jgi:hypothetical protein
MLAEGIMGRDNFGNTTDGKRTKMNPNEIRLITLT